MYTFFLWSSPTCEHTCTHHAHYTQRDIQTHIYTQTYFTHKLSYTHIHRHTSHTDILYTDIPLSLTHTDILYTQTLIHGNTMHTYIDTLHIHIHTQTIYTDTHTQKHYIHTHSDMHYI